jgi:hypothetical protein
MSPASASSLPLGNIKAIEGGKSGAKSSVPPGIIKNSMPS